MATYAPASPRLAAEEYELSDVPLAGPSRSPEASTSGQDPSRRRRRSSHAKSVRAARVLTIPSEDTAGNLLFAAPVHGSAGGGGSGSNAAAGPSASPIRSRSHRLTRTYSPESPTIGTPKNQWNSFLDENHDPDHAGSGAAGASSHGMGYPPIGQTEQVEVPDFSHMLGFNPDDEDHYGVAGAMRNPWKRRMYLLMEEPGSGREAFFIHVLVTGAILFSAILTTFSTLPAFHTDPGSVRMLFGLDTFLVILFTVEYIARSVAHSDTLNQYYHWATSFFPILDLIAILPYYIEVARGQDTSILFRFSILRTLRLLRVFRAFKYQNQMLLTIEVMYVAVHRSKDALIALSYFIILVLVLFSTLIYFAERGTWDASIGGFVDADGDPSLFDSIPQTAWFALVTMATVGYGDVVPRSFLGKILTVPLLMFGLLLIALPSFVLGRNFAIVFDAMNRQALKAPSVIDISSPRESIDEPAPDQAVDGGQPSQVLHAAPGHMSQAASSSASPYLPLANGEPVALYPAPGKRSSPNPAMLPGVSGRPGGRANEVTPRMWDGAFDGTAVPEERTRFDLSNVKLAKNQMVLSDQITSMRRQIDRQSELINQLIAALSLGSVSKPPVREDGPNGLGLVNGYAGPGSRAHKSIRATETPETKRSPRGEKVEERFVIDDDGEADLASSPLQHSDRSTGETDTGSPSGTAPTEEKRADGR